MARATPASSRMGGVICHLMTLLESAVGWETENRDSVDPPKVENSSRVSETFQLHICLGALGGAVGSLTHGSLLSKLLDGTEHLFPQSRTSHLWTWW